MATKYKTPAQQAKATAWKWCSLVVRTVDCLLTTGDPDYGECYTCGNRKPIGELDAGHFVGGRSNAVLFQRRGVRAQCVECNKWKGGNYKAYYTRLIDDYGQEFVDDLQAAKYLTVSFTEQDYRSIANFYRLYYNSLKYLSGRDVRRLMK